MDNQERDAVRCEIRTIPREPGIEQEPVVGTSIGKRGGDSTHERTASYRLFVAKSATVYELVVPAFELHGDRCRRRRHRWTRDAGGGVDVGFVEAFVDQQLRHDCIQLAAIRPQQSSRL